jgi:hypothetical protein
LEEEVKEDTPEGEESDSDASVVIFSLPKKMK